MHKGILSGYTSSGVQASPELVLIARPGANYDDGNIRSRCSFNGCRETILVIRPSLASLTERNGALRGIPNALIRGDAVGHGRVNDIIAVLSLLLVADIKRTATRLDSYVNITVGHGANDGDMGVLGDGESLFVILK